MRIRSADFVDFGGHCEVSVKCFNKMEASFDLGFFAGDRYDIVAWQKLQRPFLLLFKKCLSQRYEFSM